jgi:hypothetical protein
VNSGKGGAKKANHAKPREYADASPSEPGKKISSAPDASSFIFWHFLYPANCPKSLPRKLKDDIALVFRVDLLV